jgi:uncharacterized membrane protein
LSHPLLSASFRDWIEKKIESFEKQTSCELKLHIEEHNDADLMDRAAFVFDHLGMKKTKSRNAILLYIQLYPSRLAIIGDQGFQFLSNSDWEQWKQVLILAFQKNEFESGIENFLQDLLDKVKTVFPYQADDVNEISNQISRGI